MPAMCSDLVRILRGDPPRHMRGAATLEGVPLSMAREKPLTFLKTVFRGFFANNWALVSTYFGDPGSTRVFATCEGRTLETFFGSRHSTHIHRCRLCGDLFFGIRMDGVPNKEAWTEQWQSCYKHDVKDGGRPRAVSGKQFLTNLQMMQAVSKVGEQFSRKFGGGGAAAAKEVGTAPGSEQTGSLGISAAGADMLVSWLKKNRQSRHVRVGLFNNHSRTEKDLFFRVSMWGYDNKMESCGVGLTIQQALGKAMHKWGRKNTKEILSPQEREERLIISRLTKAEEWEKQSRREADKARRTVISVEREADKAREKAEIFRRELDRFRRRHA